MAAVVDTDGELRYLGDYVGSVKDNADPSGAGRAKVIVPGLIEEPGAWAYPIGGSHSSGARGQGAYDVPPRGATVVVSFVDGNPDRPQYKGAWHGKGEHLSRRPANPKDAHKLKVFESERFLIVLDGIGGEEELLVQDKTTGDRISMKPSETRIKATAKVVVEAPIVELGGDGLTPLTDGVVLASGIDTLTGVPYGALGSASSRVMAKKT